MVIQTLLHFVPSLPSVIIYSKTHSTGDVRWPRTCTTPWNSLSRLVRNLNRVNSSLPRPHKQEILTKGRYYLTLDEGPNNSETVKTELDLYPPHIRVLVFSRGSVSQCPQTSFVRRVHIYPYELSYTLLFTVVDRCYHNVSSRRLVCLFLIFCIYCVFFHCYCVFSRTKDFTKVNSFIYPHRRTHRHPYFGLSESKTFSFQFPYHSMTGWSLY